YAQIAAVVLGKFLTGEIEKDVIEKLTAEAYNFEVPIEQLENGLYLMRLDQGPTASFKDFAARIMARMMAYFGQRAGRKLTVLVATSGDTGGAIAHAFAGLKDISVVVLFPEIEVTERQRRQMTTLGGNVLAVAVKGKFDDCQAMVKRAFNDSSLTNMNLTSANSINFGRLLPQAVYYCYAWSKVGGNGLAFSVPSGNFGNLCGGILARKMGLPVRKFVVAVNENDEFPRFLATGLYQPVVPSRKCSSNAMNVGHPSNLARLVDWYGGWLTDERDATGKVIRLGVIKELPDMEKMRQDLVSFSINEEEVNETIRSVYQRYGVILEPHGAVGFRAAKKADLAGPVVVLETAHPAKFPEKIRELLGVEPDLPPSLSNLDKFKESYETIPNEYSCLVQLLKNRISS
ncbi:MAG: threonine synthase, partial [Candidatus Omnitrophica bacterium]|nr:threonine synthase [Candidatus Omnitrophota bacterium]